MNVAALPNKRNHTYSDISYTIEQQADGLFHWEFSLTELGMPVPTKCWGTGTTLQEAHEKAQRRIDITKQAAGIAHDLPAIA